MKEHAQVIFLIFLCVGFLLLAKYILKSSPAGEQTAEPNGTVEEQITEPGETKKPAQPQQPEPSSDETSAPEEILPPPENREGTVYISGVATAWGDRPIRITLRTNLKEGETVNIDDWEIEGNDGKISIPEAVNYYEIPSLNKSGPIILEPGHYIIIYVGEESPISKNFRLNKCTGYLNDRGEFEWQLPNECPLPEKGDYKHLSGECQNYIRSLNRCELPDPNVTNSFIGEEGNECRAFVNSFFNVKNCYEYYEDQGNLLKNEWRVWINYQNVFDKNHDWLKLLNKEGKIIDEYTY